MSEALVPRNAGGFVADCECIFHALNRATSAEMGAVLCVHRRPNQ